MNCGSSEPVNFSLDNSFSQVEKGGETELLFVIRKVGERRKLNLHFEQKQGVLKLHKMAYCFRLNCNKQVSAAKDYGV